MTAIIAYNAESRVASSGSATYTYDGDGNRVIKTNSAGTTLYWPSPVTGILDESNSTATAFAPQVYLGGLKVWSADTTGNGRFLFPDHLGSTRVTANALGTVLDDIDYRSFGSVAANYGSAQSDNHYLFTGYESDATDTSTDYATFRNQSYTLGRFSRPDPYYGSYELTNPQSLNRYTYTLNNPLAWIDPLGLDWQCISDSWTITQIIYLNDDGTELGGATTFNDNDDASCTNFDSSTYTISYSTDSFISSAPNNGAPQQPSKNCGGILAKGALQTGLDAVGIIPGEGTVAAAFYGGKEAFQAVQFASGLGSTTMSVAGGDTVGVSFGATGAGIGILTKYSGLIKGGAEAIPVVGQFVAGGATLWDLYSTGKEYAECRGW